MLLKKCMLFWPDKTKKFLHVYPIEYKHTKKLFI